MLARHGRDCAALAGTASLTNAGPGQRLGECPRTRGQVRLEEGPAVHPHYAYQERDGNTPAQHLYRYEAIRLKGLDSVATAYGTTDNAAREAMYEQLKRKGVMPEHEQG